MSSAAAHAEPPLPPPRPSVFISYASEDRAPTRLLRDALDAAGLDVWYDENELGGGDAWDQKIRRQIRECTYFMPVISARTEARREGYFRREWRLAVDRSHDMADDVMFLLPVVIDGTGENGARVPEKFLTVQWLRVPDGVATPALTALAQRLVSGDHTLPPRPAPSAARPAAAATSTPRPIPPPLAAAPAAPPDGPPPMPPFPPRPADPNDNLRYFAEILWWILTTAWLLFKRLPKWARVLLTVWAVLSLLSFGSKESKPEPRPKPKPASAAPVPPKAPKIAADAAELKAAAKKLEDLAAQPDTGNLGAGFARAGAEIVRAIAKEVAPVGAETVAIVPFEMGAGGAAAKRFADDVFTRAFGRLAVARPGQFVLQPAADPKLGDAELVAAGRDVGAARVLVARVETEDGESHLVVRLIAAKEAATEWTARYPLRQGNAAETADKIIQAVLTALPRPAAKP